MKPLPRAEPGSIVTLDAELYNYLAENIERLDKWVVKPPLNLHQTPAGNLLSLNSRQGELVLVGIIGTESGGGKYKGTILTGQSTGSATTNFQLAVSLTQSATDGPAYATSGGLPVNNALVINLMEQFVGGTHMLWAPTADLMYVMGRNMGQTAETPSRTIVYVEQWPLAPVVAKISGSLSTSYGGVYYGRMAQGIFPSAQNSYSSPMAGYAGNAIPSVDDCWIVNNWEQTNNPNSAANALPAGTYVWGFMSGYPAGAYTGGTSTNNTWYMVYTWTPPQATSLSIPNLTTGQTPGSVYGTNEQGMLSNIKNDLTTLRGTIATLYGNLKSAGYTL